MSNPYLVCSDRELRALPTQWLLAERWDKAGSLLSDLNFAEAKTRRVGIDELLRDHTTALRLLPKDNSWLKKVMAINRVLDRQAYWLRNWDAQEQPTFFLQQIRQIRNETFAKNFEQWQADAETELFYQKRLYMIEHYPTRHNPAEIRTLLGHSDHVNDVALSADGQLAVSASDDNTLKVWDIPTGRELHTLMGHDKGVKGVALSADGRLAISTSWDKTLKVWDIPTGREIRTLIDGGAGNDVALSADGRLAVASSGWTLKVWDVKTGQVLRTLTGHKGPVQRVALSADGRLAVSASRDNSLKVWDVETGHKLHTLQGHSEGVQGVALSADGRLGISVLWDNSLKVWDISTGRKLRTLKGTFERGHGWSKGVALSPDGRLAVSASFQEFSSTLKMRSQIAKNTKFERFFREISLLFRWRENPSFDYTLIVWDVETGREVQKLTGHSEIVRGVELSTDGRIAVSASNDKTIKVWNVSTHLTFPAKANKTYSPAHSIQEQLDRQFQEDEGINADVATEDDLYTRTRHSGEVNSVALSADGRLAVSASSDWTLKVWDVETGQALCTLTGHSFPVIDVTVSADGRLAISSPGYDSITAKPPIMWDLITGNKHGTPVGQYDKVNGSALSADGHLAVFALQHKTLEVWDMVRWHKLHTLMGHDKGVKGVALSADGQLAVSASDDNTLKVWDIPTGRELHTLIGHDKGVKGVALSADGRLAISTSWDKTLKVWDIPTGRELHTLIGHSGFVHGVALSANGRLAASASSDQTLKVWDTALGCCIATLLVGVPLSCCAMSADGKTIIAGDSRDRVHFLEIVNADELLAKDIKIEKSWR